MKTLLEVIKLSAEYLEKCGIKSCRREAEQLVADAMGLERIDLYMQHDRPLSDKELGNCRAYIQRRGKGEPSQYIHGEIAFYNCTIKVTPDVLIPRQETEILVDMIAKRLEKESLQGKELWDICCGSGCIGIALKAKFPELKVVLSDLSEKALAVAQQNAEVNEVDVEVIHGDLLQPFSGRRADYIVSNPPYVSEKEFLHLEREVKDFEPRTALVAGNEGMEIYERFAEGLKDVLNREGKVWLEIGKDQGKAVTTLFLSKGYRKISVEKDWSGHDRFFFLENE